MAPLEFRTMEIWDIYKFCLFHNDWIFIINMVKNKFQISWNQIIENALKIIDTKLYFYMAWPLFMLN